MSICIPWSFPKDLSYLTESQIVNLTKKKEINKKIITKKTQNIYTNWSTLFSYSFSMATSRLSSLSFRIKTFGLQSKNWNLQNICFCQTRSSTEINYKEQIVDQHLTQLGIRKFRIEFEMFQLEIFSSRSDWIEKTNTIMWAKNNESFVCVCMVAWNLCVCLSFSLSPPSLTIFVH